ncbi:iron hydrogenase small subunit, partial [Aduncisulcus paluster]
FIEIMGCSGGCVCGGGQPQQPADILNSGIDIRVERAKALYEEDSVKELRKSHQNPMIQDLYKNFLGEPNSHKAHELLHTHYKAREAFTQK